MKISARIGMFLLIVGGLSLVIFYATIDSEAPAYEFFLAGLIGLIVGFALITQGREQADESGRFRLLRSRRKKDKKEEE
jgi:xanthosine utilization system XapX-like protein